MLERIIGVFKLDTKVFQDIEQDQTATRQAAIVVAIVAALSVVGVLIGGLVGAVSGAGSGLGNTLLQIALTFVMAFVNWIIWSAVTYFVGTRLFGGQADLGEMLRVIGFAQAPQMLQIIPCIGGLVGWIWSLVASFFAIREGLDFDTGKAIGTVVIGWIVVLVVNIILGSVLGIGTLGLGALTGMFQR